MKMKTHHLVGLVILFSCDVTLQQLLCESTLKIDSTKSNCQCHSTNINCKNLNLTVLNQIEINNSSNIHHLTLTGNNLGRLKSPLFSFSLPDLRSLDLSSSNITEIIDLDQLLANLPSLTYLSLKNNSLAYIDQKQLVALKRTHSDLLISLENNNFRCDCQLASFIQSIIYNTSSLFIEDAHLLRCTHRDSFAVMLDQPMLNLVNIGKVCSLPSSQASFTLATSKTFYPYRPKSKASKSN